MTVKTRRRIVLCVVAMILTLPVETILLRAISTPSTLDGVRAWVAALAADQLEGAADQIQAYPFLYRREIARALPAPLRARMWTRHISAYKDTHPGLNPAAVELFDEALALVTPTFFTSPTSDERAHAKKIGDELAGLIGREEAEFVLYRLGPRDGLFASRVPMTERAVNWVRRMIVVFANAEDCDCSSDWGCGTSGNCRTGVGCTPDDSWPACGWLWSETCDGLCGMSSSN